MNPKNSLSTLSPSRAAALPYGVLLISGLALTSISQAEEPISTDRPDFVESSLVVGAGRAQIETSVAYERDARGGDTARTLAVPTLVRLGLGEAWEARLETDGWLRQRVEDSAGDKVRATGFSDIALGVKYHVPGEGPFKASSAFLFHVDLDTGAEEFRGDGVRPSLRYVAEWELTDRWAMGVMPGLAYNTDDTGDRYVSGIAGITVAYSWTEKFRSFAEIAAEELGASKHADAQVSFDTGVAYLVTNNVQLDAAVYSGLNKNTPDTTGTLGLSIRW